MAFFNRAFDFLIVTLLALVSPSFSEIEPSKEQSTTGPSGEDEVARTDRIKLVCHDTDPENFMSISWYAIDDSGEPHELYRVDNSGHVERVAARSPHARLTYNLSAKGTLTVHGASCSDRYVHKCWRWARDGYEDEGYFVVWNKDCQVIRVRDRLIHRPIAWCPATKTKEISFICPMGNPDDFIETTWWLTHGERTFRLFSVEKSGGIKTYGTNTVALPTPCLTHDISCDGSVLLVRGTACHDTFLYRCERTAKVGERDRFYNFMFSPEGCE